jgi:hypothetical protein
MKAKLMMCLMALSVALTGYISCLIASPIHWHYGWITAPAILPGLSFGLVTAGWLLHRSWISRRKGAGLIAGSTVAYFAAYWSAFYIFILCGRGMILSESRLPLFHAGMIAGLVGTALLTASLAVFSADFRRKDWKTLIIIGTAAGGALCLAGIGGNSDNHAGTLGNPGDRVFIVVWQLLVGGYIGMLLLGAPSSLSRASERGRIAHWATRAVLVLLLASFVQAAIGYSRGDKGSRVASPATSGDSNAPPSTLAAHSAQDSNTPGDQGQAIAFGGMWLLHEGGPLELLQVTKLQNVSGKPIKAFRAVLYKTNDFGEVLSKDALEFSSGTRYGRRDQPTSGHLIQPKEIIYLHEVSLRDLRWGSGINEIFEKVARDQKALDGKAIDLDPKHFRLEVQQVVFGD